MDELEVRALLRDDAFSHPAADLDLIETHISWVVLAGDFAYKIKKPVELEFLDFSTLALRRDCCEEELRLNRRIAPALYLGVTAITSSADGPVIGGDGDVIDYAVCMRRFSQRKLASVAAAEGRLTFARCRELGRTVASFHNSLAPIQIDDAGDERQPGTPTAILAALRQNFAQIDDELPKGEDRSFLWDLEQSSLADYQRLESRMWDRLRDGFIRECHGDLHLGNIVLLDDKVLPFDCIEFNAAFRIVDIQCEIGFLVMDLESRSLPGHANRVLNRWLEHTGDYAGLALHSFYDCYLSMVRAKISLISSRSESSRETGMADFRRYFALAAAGRRRLPGFLCITMGVSGSGKSTIAEVVAADFSAIELRSDVERKRMFGLAPDADSEEAGLTDDLYSKESSDRVFQRLVELAELLLDAGQPVIVDATFIERARRAPFMALAARRKLPFVIARFVASETELKHRLQGREKQGGGASEAGIEVMLRQQSRVELPGTDETRHCIVVDTEADQHIESLIGEVERRITSHPPE